MGKTVVTYYDFFKNIVSQLRLYGDISGLSDNLNNTYTFQSVDYVKLKVGRWIQLGNFVAEITDITGDIITVRAKSGQDITGITTFQRLDPYFNADIQARTTLMLSLKDTDYDYSKQKFPLIELVLNDINSVDNWAEYAEYSTFELIFSMSTKENWTGAERIENNFKPILWPLYFQFCKLLYENNISLKPENIEINRKDIFLASYGNYQKNTKNHFVDAIKIEIKNLKLPIEYICLT